MDFRKHVVKYSICTILAIGVSPICGATYYVATTGNNGNNGSQGSPWLTIQFALTNRISSTVVSNDIVRVQAGTYSERVTWTNHGVTVIGDGLTKIQGGFLLQSANYYKILNIQVTHSNNPGGFNYEAVRIESSIGGLIDGCYFHHCDLNILTLRNNSDNTTVRRTEISHSYWPNYPWLTTSDGGSLVFIGGGTTTSTNIVVEHCWFHDADDYIAGGLPGNIWLVVRNCRDDPVPPTTGGHTDKVQPNHGWTNMLIEANWHQNGNSSDHHSHGHYEPNGSVIQNGLIIRGDVNLSSGGLGMFGSGGLAHYHNTTHSNNTFGAGNDRVVYLSTSSAGNESYNNIYSYCVKVGNSPSQAENGATLTEDYNLSVGQAAMTGGTHNLTSSPLFVSPATNETTVDLHLQSGSPARSVAGPITLANGAGSSSTAITMDNARMFWPGDTITVGGVAATILTIDSQTTATLASAISWSDNAIILWRGQTDLGALPFGSVPLSSATMLRSGTTYTVSPVGDARHVIFYQDGIPNTTDSAAPFQATIASGTVTAVACSLYAQPTNLWVLASDLGESGSNPYRNKGRASRSAGIIP